MVLDTTRVVSSLTPSAERAAISATRWLALLVCALGVLVLVGWELHLPVLTSLETRWVPMKPNTALSFVASGAALLLLTSRRRGNLLAGRLAAILVLAISVLTLAEYSTGRSFGIDGLLLPGAASPALRMAIATALCFGLAGVALLLPARTTGGFRPSEVLAGAILFISYVGLLGYPFQIKTQFILPQAGSMALHSCVGFILLAGGILAADPEGSIVSILASRTVGGTVARRLLPAAAILPAVIALLAFVGQQMGFYGERGRLTLTTVSSVFVFALLIVSTASALRVVNEQARRANAMLDELVGTHIDELIHPQGPFTTGQPLRVAGDTFLRSDGTDFPVQYTASPIVDAEVVRGAVVSFADISERRRLEQRLEQISRIDSVGRMAATIAHEFNNVLMGIQPFAEVIRRKGGSDESLQKAAGHILNSVARGKGITQDLLRMSKAAEPQLRSVELIPRIEQLASEIRALVGARINIELDVPAGDALFVLCDPGQMQQVLTNVAVNARDAMGGNGTLRIAAERAGSHVRMIVADNGCGIPAETLPYIFEPLFTTKQSGAGLGLAVAQQIIVRNGGAIAVESAVGEGTRFTIELPAAQPPECETVSTRSSELLGIERVLIVEDDPTVASGLAAILESEGVGVQIVDRGADAPKAFALFEPNVVMIDVSLPDMNGAEVYEKIVARWPNVAVIFSTGHADESRLPKTRSEHVGFLCKPYSSEVLLNKLREVV